ncbi:hypothetical protein GALMADRAFT_228417 [Galerina marginata CBS 339.88]|uniref:ER transporter 6TM N-terminal domain-containing protein n=1 Tax=Galerina marginata (strain CBS 339.88) TaxID=685588 RepID=A0A067SR07_GALM3|nr:hypothetical protein GALMADRAFT_228417 [Galerina marginata CBS 339.88]
MSEISTQVPVFSRTDLDRSATSQESPILQGPEGNEVSIPPSGSSKTVKIAQPDAESLASSCSSSSTRRSTPKWLVPVIAYLAGHFAWVPQNLVWSKVKPVIRCALVTWVSTVLFLIPAVMRMMGQAGFLIIIAGFLSPPCDPFMAVAEREILILLLTSLAWAWCCLGIFLANLARTHHNPMVTFPQAISGQYIEAAPAVITAVFIFFGTSVILWFRAKQGPGPYLFACILACICIDICMTTSILFPFPYYLVGRSILIPLALHSALALVASVIIFPSTISALFTSRLAAALAPHLSIFEDHRKLLATSPSSPEFAPLYGTVIKGTKACESALVGLAAAARLLKSDLIYGRFSPDDFTTFQKMLRRLAGRADGLAVFFSLVNPAREKFPVTAGVTPLNTAPGTPNVILSRTTSRTTSMERNGVNSSGDIANGIPLTPVSTPRRSIHQPVQNKHSHSHAYSTTPSHMYLHSSPQSLTEQRGLDDENLHHNQYGHHHHHHHHGQGHPLHSSLLTLARARAKKPEQAVGTFESQRYLNLEATRLWDPNEEEFNERTGSLLNESCDALLEQCTLGIKTANEWLSTVRDARLPEFFATIGLLPSNPDETSPKHPRILKMLERLGEGQNKRREERRRREERMKEMKEVRSQIANTLEAFRNVGRHAVLEPYRTLFDESKSHPASPSEVAQELEASADQKLAADASSYFSKEKEGEQGREYVVPAHRYLFHCYIYQYNLTQIASIILEMLDQIIKLEEERLECRLWTPVQSFRWNSSAIPESGEDIDEGDDDPDVIQGINRERPSSSDSSSVHTEAGDPSMPSKTTGPAFPVDSATDLGLPRRRDPDALPPRNIFESFLRGLHYFLVGLGSGNAIFGMKAGLLTVILSIPSLLKSTAKFAYVNRFVWAIFMGQLTLGRFRGDTAFGLSARIVSTFFGAIMGMLMWYISCGSSRGNAYGLATVCAICYPFFFFARLYWPIAPMRNIILFVTSILVIGYSYQDIHLQLPGNIGFGWSVAWKRFVLVTCGVVAAFIVSLFPPSTTIRCYQRNLLATTSSEVGNIYCAILSFANTKHKPEIQEIISSLLAVRNKLAKATMLRTNVVYEFSLKGRWPADRYQKIVDLQIGLSFSLSHLMSVLEHLEPSWSRAFLKRTRFMDPGFQGDVLAVISMISFSLRTGSPLPQITPCPLIDRFMLKYHGLDVIHKDSEEDYGLPRTLSINTLRDEQYMMFSVGISTAFSFITRLDHLMLAVKEVVGEQYHIHGVGAVRYPMPPGYTGSLGANSLAPGGRGKLGGGGGVDMGSRTNTVHFDPAGHGV